MAVKKTVATAAKEEVTATPVAEVKETAKKTTTKKAAENKEE